MQFSVGYQVLHGAPDYFSEIVRDYRENIREVYFAWPGSASGREPVSMQHVSQVREELKYIRGMGGKLNLLFNASCYGAKAASGVFGKKVIALVKKIKRDIGLDGITTLSPVIARAVRDQYPDLDVRASVNMKLGTVQALEYVQDYFTSFYVQREYNRDPERLQQLQEWADINKKELYILVNSGCLHSCPFQTFHDNLVAHGKDAGFVHRCRDLFSDPANRVEFLKSSWIRPEDITKHAEIFKGGYKLATRKHDNPRLVIDAYVRGKFYGNLPDLMEPGFGPQWQPDIIDNSRFPEDWFERTNGCKRECGQCSYCRQVIEDASGKPFPTGSSTSGKPIQVLK